MQRNPEPVPEPVLTPEQLDELEEALWRDIERDARIEAADDRAMNRDEAGTEDDATRAEGKAAS